MKLQPPLLCKTTTNTVLENAGNNGVNSIVAWLSNDIRIPQKTGYDRRFSDTFLDKFKS
jgi:hypothetical protein